MTEAAIIILPALILIPIAKLVALFIAGFSIPALGISALISKLFGSKLSKIITLTLIALVILAVVLAIILKTQNPDRPWI